jgi:hypothetical protein
MKNTYWKVNILNPATECVIEENTFESITNVAEKYKTIPLTTWRNIALGRSKIYNKFITMEKLNRKTNKPTTSDTESDEEETNKKNILTFD